MTAISGKKITLRQLRVEDVCERYVQWLRTPEINQYLETRWHDQTMETVKTFVETVLKDPDSFLFAILDNTDEMHIGNLKIGPINRNHLHADISYFLGEKSRWGKGLATDAILVASEFGFKQLGLHRLQAGVYSKNIASCRALEKAGYKLEGRLVRKLKVPGGWEDHLWYGLINSNFQ